MSAHSTSPSSRAGGRPILPLIVIGLAVAMQLAVAVPFTIGMGLLAPLWAIIVGWALWLVAAGTLVVTARRRPLLTPLVPVTNAALLFAFVTFGDSVLGWTA
jgi:type IV secretory pathway TrbD component